MAANSAAELLFASDVTYTARRVARIGVDAESRCVAVERELTQRMRNDSSSFESSSLNAVRDWRTATTRLRHPRDDESDNGGLARRTGATKREPALLHEQNHILGAYLADAGHRRQDTLPLRKLQQVIVRDDHDVTLTVRPPATEDPGLALTTLAVEPTSSAK